MESFEPTKWIGLLRYGIVSESDTDPAEEAEEPDLEQPQLLH